MTGAGLDGPVIETEVDTDQSVGKLKPKHHDAVVHGNHQTTTRRATAVALITAGDSFLLKLLGRWLALQRTVIDRPLRPVQWHPFRTYVCVIKVVLKNQFAGTTDDGSHVRR